MNPAGYDPFAAGSFPVGVRTVEALDQERGRLFPCEIWYPADSGGADGPAGLSGGRDAPAAAGAHPLIVFSHFSGGDRRSSSFLCTHLASHGYAVAALDHSEVVARDLAPRGGETKAERAARIDAVIASRVPDVRFLLDYMLGRTAEAAPAPAASSTGAANSTAAANSAAAGNGAPDIGLDDSRIGLVGHSFGGWTALATPDAEPLVRAVVAMGPGGNSRPRPGILPLTLDFAWGRDVPTLYLAAENDVPIPLDGVCELFDRTPASKRMFILRRADHQHFVDDVETAHEAVRAMSLSGDAAWIPAAMRPITELCSGERAHTFARGLTLAHLDATLRQVDAAERILADGAAADLARHEVDAFAYRP